MDVYALDLDKNHGVPREGALVFSTEAAQVRFDYTLFRTAALGLRVRMDPGEPRVSTLLRVPGLSLSLGLEAKALRGVPDFELGGSLDWSEGELWTHWAAGGERDRGCLDLSALVLGGVKQRRRVRSTTIETVLLPEGAYPCVVSLLDVTLWRERLPRVTRRTFSAAEVRFLFPLPFPGKGEDAWNLGEDAVSESYLPRVGTVAEALAHVAGDVMRQRERRGGRRWVPEAPYAPLERPTPLPFLLAPQGPLIETAARLLGAAPDSFKAYRAEHPKSKGEQLGLLVLRANDKPDDSLVDRARDALNAIVAGATGASETRVVLRVNDQLLEVKRDGLAPFDVALWPGPLGALA